MLSLNLIKEWVNQNITRFHEDKLKCLNKLNLKKILKNKNPYLFKSKNINLAYDLIIGILDAYLSSSEEKIFGDFLENLAIYVAKTTYNGRKSSATGIDLELNKNDIHYLISIKSGPNWGNSSQHKKQEEDFKKALKVLKQNHSVNADAILGICYGKTRSSFTHVYWKLVGQNFWYFISGNVDLYLDIIEPLGYKAKEHNENFEDKKNQIINKFTQEFTNEYCLNGIINWKKLVKYNSGNIDIKENKGSIKIYRNI